MIFCNAVFHSPPLPALQKKPPSLISIIHSLLTQMYKPVSLGFFVVVRLVWFGLVWRFLGCK